MCWTTPSSWLYASSTRKELSWIGPSAAQTASGAATRRVGSENRCMHSPLHYHFAPMALKATIFKVDLSVADIDRGYYADHSLTIARHPSETDERMMVRVLAFALHAGERLEFGRGLSSEDEPDLVQRDLTGAIECWIEVGLPDEREVRKACGRAREVHVLAYGRGVDLWWQGARQTLDRQ